MSPAFMQRDVDRRHLPIVELAPASMLVVQELRAAGRPVVVSQSVPLDVHPLDRALIVRELERAGLVTVEELGDDDARLRPSDAEFGPALEVSAGTQPGISRRGWHSEQRQFALTLTDHAADVRLHVRRR